MKTQPRNKILFLVPTWPPHFEYAEDFAKSFKKHRIDEQADMCFVFTSEEEEALFPVSGSGRIVIPKSLRIIKERFSGIINIKKIYGLMQMKDKYDYIIVFDDETKIIKNIDLYEMCEKYFRDKRLWGNKTGNPLADIKEKCIEYFRGPDGIPGIPGGGGVIPLVQPAVHIQNLTFRRILQDHRYGEEFAATDKHGLRLLHIHVLPHNPPGVQNRGHGNVFILRHVGVVQL